MLIKNSKNYTKIIIFYYYLFLLLAEARIVPYPLKLFRGFGGGESFPLPLGYATGVHCTVYNETSQFSQFPMQIKMQLILTVFPLVEEGKIMRCFDMP